MEQIHPAPHDNARLVRRLLLLVAAAFVFAFAMVPLYDVLCEATGFNGKTAGGIVRDGFAVGGLKAGTTTPTPAVDVMRTVRVEFTGTVRPGLPWDMRPLTIRLDLHPGEMQQVSYLVRHTSNREVTGQAVPSVTPGQAAQHFEKILYPPVSGLGPNESNASFFRKDTKPVYYDVILSASLKWKSSFSFGS